MNETKTLVKIRRNVLSNFNFVPLSERPNGITAFVRTRQDEWLTLSLESIKHVADEILVIDTGEEARNVIDDFEEQQGKKITYISIPKLHEPLDRHTDFVGKTQIGIEKSKYKWLLEWNADMIACEDTMMALRTYLFGLHEKKHYYFFMPCVHLERDIYHTNKVYPQDIVHPEESFLYRHSRDLKIDSSGRYAKVKIPPYYRPVQLKGCHFFHLNTVKNRDRLVQRLFWNKLRALSLTIEEYPEVIRNNLDRFTKY